MKENRRKSKTVRVGQKAQMAEKDLNVWLIIISDYKSNSSVRAQWLSEKTKHYRNQLHVVYKGHTLDKKT